MSKILTLMSIVVMSFTTMAQAPEGINYQAVIRNNVGDIIPSQPVGLKISILQGSSTGAAIYEESFTPTTNQFGLINIVVGQGTVLSGNFPTIDWGNGPYFVEVAADASGGTNYTVMGTQQLMSVPYALYSKYSENPGPQGPAGNDGATGPQGATGAQGPTGNDGADGLSAYEVWLSQGNTGTEADFLNSLQGADGATGPQGPAGNDGPQGPQGISGNDGADGLSAYEVWLSQGNTGTEADFLNSLQGADGATGPQGPAGNDGATGPQGATGAQGLAGNDGADGLSAYEVWLSQGNTGTEADFLNSLQGVDGSTGPQGPAGNDGTTGPQGPAGNDGADGLSAYEVWLSQGNTGTEADFLNSLQGADGAAGPQGPAGNDGATGPQGATGPSGPAGGRGRPTVGNTCTSGCWTLPGWTLSGGTGANHTLAAGCGYLPIYVDKNKSFVQIGIYNNVAISGLCRLGIYSWNDGFPDTLLMDLGLIDITGGGNRSIPINLNIDEGFYFVAIATNNGIFANGIEVAAHNPPVTAGWNSLTVTGDRVVLTQTSPFVDFTGGFPNQITGPYDNAYDYFYNIRFQEAP